MQAWSIQYYKVLTRCLIDTSRKGLPLPVCFFLPAPGRLPPLLLPTTVGLWAISVSFHVMIDRSLVMRHTRALNQVWGLRFETWSGIQKSRRAVWLPFQSTFSTTFLTSHFITTWISMLINYLSRLPQITLHSWWSMVMYIMLICTGIIGVGIYVAMVVMMIISLFHFEKGLKENGEKY